MGLKSKILISTKVSLLHLLSTKVLGRNLGCNYNTTKLNKTQLAVERNIMEIKLRDRIHNSTIRTRMGTNNLHNLKNEKKVQVALNGTKRTDARKGCRSGHHRDVPERGVAQNVSGKITLSKIVIFHGGETL